MRSVDGDIWGFADLALWQFAEPALYFTVCGIAGILRVHPPGAPAPPAHVAIPESWLDLLDESIKHRGPDGQGQFRDRATRPDGSVVDVALVHRRLAIIDPAGGHQPMVWDAESGLWPRDRVEQRARGGSDGSLGSVVSGASLADARGSPQLVAVVFNGCIYNHRELRKELQAAGHRFETDHSDTEVLIHGWRQWRTELPDRLEGMFAFMLWDRAEEALFGARDRFGEKPLYYTVRRIPQHYHDDWNDPRFCAAFSSTPAGLYQLGEHLDPGPGVVNRREVISDWLRDGFGLDLPIQGVRQVPASMSIRIVPGSPGTPSFYGSGVGRLRHQSYSDELPVGPGKGLAAGEVERLLRASVRERLESDVGLGCFLSGGVDSSLIAAFAREDRGSLRTFTVAMPDARYDESAYAKRVAQVIGADHTLLDCQAQPVDDLVRLVSQLGLPLGDSSLLPTYWVCAAAKQEVDVVLTGDGADELFFGYDRYVAADILERHGWISRLPASLMRDRNPHSRVSKLRRLVEAARGLGYLDLRAIFPHHMLRQIAPYATAPAWEFWRRRPWRGLSYAKPATGTREPRRITVRSIERGLGRLADVGIASTLARRRDVEEYLPDDILRKVDTAAMSRALETRAPFLGTQLADAALSAGSHSLMPRGQRKGLLRQVARKYLPAEIVDRPKQGFAIPIGEWFRTDYGGMKTLLLDHLNSSEPWGPPALGIELNMKFVRQMLDEHLGTGPSALVRRDHSQRLYMLLVLSIWAKWVGSL